MRDRKRESERLTILQNGAKRFIQRNYVRIKKKKRKKSKAIFFQACVLGESAMYSSLFDVFHSCNSKMSKYIYMYMIVSDIHIYIFKVKNFCDCNIYYSAILLVYKI